MDLNSDLQDFAQASHNNRTWIQWAETFVQKPDVDPPKAPYEPPPPTEVSIEQQVFAPKPAAAPQLNPVVQEAKSIVNEFAEIGRAQQSGNPIRMAWGFADAYTFTFGGEFKGAAVLADASRLNEVSRFTAVVPGTTSEEFITLYHGTSIESKESILTNGIDLSKSRNDVDFGSGFYTTTDQQQAIDFANKTFKGNGAVITSQIPKSEFDQLAHLQLDGADDEYFNTVTENLNGRANPSGYDVTSGPVVKNPSAVRRGDVPEPSSTQSQTVLHTDDATQLFEKYIQND